MAVTVPKIVRKAVRQEAAEVELLGLHRERRRLELGAARLLARIAGARHYALRGCSSIAHYGEMYGLSGREALMLAAVGRALALRPALEERILCGKLSLDAAAALGKLFERPGLIREGEDWLAWAEQWSARQLEREVGKRLLEAETGEPASVLTAILSASGREKFERARQLASRKKKKALKEGEAVEVLSDHYLDSFDPARRQPRARRMPSTEGRPGRHRPAEVDRAVVARQGDRCAVPGCDHRIWIDKAHIRAHRYGGSREAQNLLHLCRAHHRLYDAGFLRIEGSADRPIFVTPRGRETPRAPPP